MYNNEIEYLKNLIKEKDDVIKQTTIEKELLEGLLGAITLEGVFR